MSMRPVHMCQAVLVVLEVGCSLLWCMCEMDVVFNQHDVDFFLLITVKRLCE